MKRGKRTRKRRGVILLVVLSLLAMFALLITTFVVIAGNYRMGAVISARSTPEGESPQKVVDNVMLSLLTDTDDATSPLRGHSLLRDMYGDDGFTGYLINHPTGNLVNTTTNGQFAEVRLYYEETSAKPGLDPHNPHDYDGRFYRLRPSSGFYNGQVLTFVTGAARGVSTRIIAYDPVNKIMRIMPTDNTSARGAPLAGDRVVVNGKPFSGTGVGFNFGTGSLDAPDPGADGEWGVADVDDDKDGIFDNASEASWLGSDDLPPTSATFTGGAALLPNRATHVDTLTSWTNYMRGHADENYDAADFQNFHLAAMIGSGFDRRDSSLVIPSFHRPALINFWLNGLVAPAIGTELNRPPTRIELLHVFLMPYGDDFDRGTAPAGPGWPGVSLGLRDAIVNLKQMLITRPLPELNPAFTGSNSAFSAISLSAAAVAGQNTFVDLDFADLDADKLRAEYFWDVDNDGDGGVDGNWMDIGLAIEEDEGGKTYKPLVSILLVDLDGRVNLNAHGSKGHLITRNSNLVQHPGNLARFGNPFTTLVPGDGSGPADINLRILFGAADPTPFNTDALDQNFQYEQYRRLLEGVILPSVPPTPIVGRYGNDLWPGFPGTDPNSTANWPVTPGWGLNQGPISRDFLSQLKFWEYPRWYPFSPNPPYANGNMDLTAFNGPPDLNSEIVVGVDHRGAPTFSQQNNLLANTRRNVRVDNPYEKDLLSISAADTLFTLTELEGLLRIFDADVSPGGDPLPQRLTMLFDNPAPPITQGNLFMNSIGAASARQAVTTHSVDLPVPNILEPPDLTAVPFGSLFHQKMKPFVNQNQQIFNPRVPMNQRFHEEYRFHNVTEILRARLIQGFSPDLNNDGLPDPPDPTPGVINNWIKIAAVDWNYPAATVNLAIRHDGRLNDQIAQLLAPNLDLPLGVRMDINRPFGNGRDDNFNGVVDEHGFFWPGSGATQLLTVPFFGMFDPILGIAGLSPGVRFPLEDGMGVDRFDNDGDGVVDELDLSEVETVKLWDADNATWIAVPVDHDNDGLVAADLDNDGRADVDHDAFLARSNFAKHLYLLGMMLIHPGWVPDLDNDGVTDDLNNDGVTDGRDRARAIAQWAVNVVDFRDADSIMTPFEYDMRPFSPRPGFDGGWGFAGQDDDGVNGVDDIGEALFPGSDDLPAWSVDGHLTILTGWLANNDMVLGTAGAPSPDDPETDPNGPGPDGRYGTFDDPLTDRDVVWGTERPELLITETFVVHDRRVEDLAKNGRVDDMMGMMVGETDTDPMDMITGNDFDQRRRPRGTMAVELYNPHTSNSQRPPGEFYHNGAIFEQGVVLEKVNAFGAPVWRMSVTTAMDDPASVAVVDILPPDPDNPSAPRSTTEGLLTERLIYFTSTLDTAGAVPVVPNLTNFDGSIAQLYGTPREAAAPQAPLNLAPVLPGRYAVVGTFRGTRVDFSDPETATVANALGGTTDADPEYFSTIGRRNDGDTDARNIRHLVMHPSPLPDENWVYLEKIGNSQGPSRWRSAATGPNDDIVDMLPPVAVPIEGLNISEGFYPVNDGMGNPYAGGYVDPFDQPFDEDLSVYGDQNGDGIGDRRSWDPSPFPDSSAAAATTLTSDGTYRAVRFIHLQRLANPLLPHHPAYNPYRTIDSMAIDLSVFNGEYRRGAPNPGTAPPATQLSDSGTLIMGGTVGDYPSASLVSLERGSTTPLPTLPFPTPDRNLWPRRTSPSTATPTVQDSTLHYFKLPVSHTLGYLNSTFGSRFQVDFSPASSQTTSPNGIVDYIGAPNTRNDLNATDEGQPFPWLHWPNRPYISHYELMQVPYASSSQLLVNHGVVAPPPPSPPLTQAGSSYSTSTVPGQRGTAEFQHLPNFHDLSVSVLGNDELQPGFNLAQILDFVHVPSKFVGTETFLNPNVFQGFIGTGLAATPTGTEFLKAPFNKIPNYREPGKVNINTIYNRLVWDAIRGEIGPQGVGPAFELMVDSRRGFGERPFDPLGNFRSWPEKRSTVPANQNWIKAGTIIPDFHPFTGGVPNQNYDPVVDTSPSIFGNPMRGFGSGSLVPWPARWSRPLSEATLLRSNRFDTGDRNLVTTPWPIPPQAGIPPLNVDPDMPMFARLTPPHSDIPYQEHMNPNLHSYMRYEPAQRMANLITTRSNVYAIWVTVGYFEVELLPPQGLTANGQPVAAANPPSVYANRFGYQLGNEVGWDTGSIERHRAFYVIDRSIPVAFEPGAVHNTENTVLLRRFIE